MTSSDDQNECPLCMEPLEVDDSSFYPCTCGYQICRFCWHRLKTDGNGLCPACRKPYSDNPAHFEPLSEDEIIRIKKERRQKELQKKQRLNENRLHLADVRVVQKNLVFVVGLSQRLADSEVLKKNEYFGRFGKILKVVINPSPQYAGTQIPSASAYLTYSKAEEALRAIQTVNNIQIDNRTLKASLGTTKYCSHFLKSATCPKQDCMYLHDFGEEAASFTKEEMSQGKHLDYESKLIETILHIPKNLQNISPINSNTNTNLNTQVSTTEVSDAENSENTEYKSKYKGKVNGTSNGISNYNRPTKSQHNLNQKSTVSASTTESVQTTPNDTNKLKQSSSATSLSVNTNTTDLITCSSLNNLNTQSTSSSSSSSSSLTPPPTLLSSQQQQQKSPIQQQQSQTIHHQSADSNNNISASNNQILANNSQYLNGSSDLNNKHQIELLTNGSLENQNNYIQHHSHQQPQSQQQNLFHEEDLGFDPWCESTRALQDLMQIENQTNTKYTNQQQHQQNNINYLSSKLANSSLSQPNANMLQSHIEYLQKQFLSKPDLLQTNTFQNTTSPSLESLLSLQHNSLLSNSLLNNAPLTNSLNSLLLTNQPKTIVPPPGFANTKFPSSTSTSNSSSTNSSASSSVNNSASSTPSMNNLSNNNKANNLLQNGSTGNLNALKSIFPNANISFGNNVNHNLNHTNQMNNNYKLSNNTHGNNYWPDDPAIISLTDPINLLNGNSGGIGSLSEFNTNLSNRSLSPGLLNGSSNNSSGIKSSFYDNFSSLQNSYSNSYQQNFENIAKLQQLQQFMLQQQFNSSINIDHHAQQQQQQQLQLLKSLQNSNQNILSNGGLNSFASLQQQLLLQQLSSFQMNTNPIQTAATGSKGAVDD